VVGWGSGFYLYEERSLTLEEMIRDREHRVTVDEIRNQAERLLDALESIISPQPPTVKHYRPGNTDDDAEFIADLVRASGRYEAMKQYWAS
jgi:hypothetical protein